MRIKTLLFQKKKLKNNWENLKKLSHISERPIGRGIKDY